ncbi:rod shape-determining protein RodA [candidate division TA06 bacterium]|nr:rod shape-determining protein RodA [candidate division TA06 bacterium]
MKNIDLPLIITTLILILFGLFVLHSAQPESGSGEGRIFLRQILWLFPALLAGTLAFLIPYRTINTLAYLFFGISIILLLIPLFSSSTTPALTRRWINLGPLQFQPSEFAKVACILALARMISHSQFSRGSLKNLLLPMGIVLLPTGLVLMEPDLGTSFIFFFLLLAILFYRKIPPFSLLFLVSPLVSLLSAFHWVSWTLFILLFLFLLYLFSKYHPFSFQQGLLLLVLNCGIGIATPLLWGTLKEYQKKRILTFLNPGLDPLGAGWHTLQSKIAIGSGGIFGTGYGQGSQKNLAFLPEQHTDFVYSVIGEELGLIGCAFLLLLFFLLIWRGLKLASESKNLTKSLAAVGLSSIFIYQVFVNMGMAIGLVPVAGLPLPFISYGGSSLVTSTIAVGLLLNIRKTKYEY